MFNPRVVPGSRAVACAASLRASSDVLAGHACGMPLSAHRALSGPSVSGPARRTRCISTTSTSGATATTMLRVISSCTAKRSVRFRALGPYTGGALRRLADLAGATGSEYAVTATERPGPTCRGRRHEGSVRVFLRRPRLCKQGHEQPVSIQSSPAYCTCHRCVQLSWRPTRISLIRSTPLPEGACDQKMSDPVRFFGAPYGAAGASRCFVRRRY
jgi:hypothetical protein